MSNGKIKMSVSGYGRVPVLGKERMVECLLNRPLARHRRIEVPTALLQRVAMAILTSARYKTFTETLDRCLMAELDDPCGEGLQPKSYRIVDPTMAVPAALATVHAIDAQTGVKPICDLTKPVPRGTIALDGEIMLSKCEELKASGLEETYEGLDALLADMAAKGW